MVRKATDAQPNEYWVPARLFEMASGSERIVLGDNRIRRGTLDWHIQKTYSTSESFGPLLGPGQCFGDGAHVISVLSSSALELADQNDRMLRPQSGCNVISDSIYSAAE